MTKTILTPDICIIGAGSGGLVVAAVAASFGVSTVLIEKGKMGGDCLNYGCVPSKALLAAGKQAYLMTQSKKFGILPAGEAKVNFAKVNQHVHDVIAEIAPNDSEERFSAMGVHVIKAKGKFLDKNTVQAGKHLIKARRFVVSTGSQAFVPPIPGLDKVDYLTNENIFENTKLPKHLIIVGGGPIGLEMAQAHHRLGAQVTVVEGLRALGKDDPELSAVVLEQLRAEGIVIEEGAMVERVEKNGKTGVAVYIGGENGEKKSIKGTHLLIATGRKPTIEGLDLEKAGIKYDRSGIKVSKDLRTSNRKVYAIGDVIGGLQFTHVAGYHAGLVIRPLLFRMKAKPNDEIIPWVTYTDPELAHVGLNEEEAKKRYGRINVLRWSLHENDRAIAERKNNGMVKLVVTPKGKILGASIVGTNAGEMIHFWALALVKKMSVKDVASYIPPYPTMSEAGKRAATNFYVPLAQKKSIRRVIGFLQKFG